MMSDFHGRKLSNDRSNNKYCIFLEMFWPSNPEPGIILYYLSGQNLRLVEPMPEQNGKQIMHINFLRSKALFLPSSFKFDTNSRGKETCWIHIFQIPNYRMTIYCRMPLTIGLRDTLA